LSPRNAAPSFIYVRSPASPPASPPGLGHHPRKGRLTRRAHGPPLNPSPRQSAAAQAFSTPRQGSSGPSPAWGSPPLMAPRPLSDGLPPRAPGDPAWAPPPCRDGQGPGWRRARLYGDRFPDGEPLPGMRKPRRTARDRPGPPRTEPDRTGPNRPGRSAAGGGFVVYFGVVAAGQVLVLNNRSRRPAPVRRPPSLGRPPAAPAAGQGIWFRWAAAAGEIRRTRQTRQNVPNGPSRPAAGRTPSAGRPLSRNPLSDSRPAL
jgi:hypothetical protein